MMRILLINPAESIPEWPTMPRAVEPMGLLYVAGAFQHAGGNVTLIDRQLGHGDLGAAYDDISRGKFNGVGIALATQACLWDALKIAQDIKNLSSSLPVFTGGVFATLNADWLLQTVPALDFVVLGEAEPFALLFVEHKGAWDQLPALYTRQDGKQPTLPVPIFAAPPDITPDRSLTGLVIEQGESPSIVASRGCGGGCSFCCISRYYGSKWKPRSVVSVINELGEIAAQFNTTRFHLVDDNLFGHTHEAQMWLHQFIAALKASDTSYSFKTTSRLDDLADNLIPDIKRAGFDLLKIGIETFCKDTQHIYGKPINYEMAVHKLNLLREAEIGVSLGFIMFDPYTSVADLHQNLEFLLLFPNYWSRHLLFTRLIAYRGTRVERYVQRDGLAYRSSIMGTQWVFRDPDVATVFDRFKTLLTEELLGLELRLYHAQKQQLRAGNKPQPLGDLAHHLQQCWIDLFQHALTRHSILTANAQDNLSCLAAHIDDYCTSKPDAETNIAY